MPQVSDNFGPLYQTVVLDGGGYGAVAFQANGANIRLSNITFAVSSVALQSQCVIYKGQIATGNRVFNSNSGSTGGNAQGNVDLFDGEFCYVVWSGGDAGATATATFTGGKIPFGEVRPSQLEGQDPIAAGDGSLVYPALKSPNYVPGVSGWFLSRDGDAEVNDLTARGEVFVPADNGGYVWIRNDGGTAVIELMPDPPVAGQSPANMLAYNVNAVPQTIPVMIIKSPAVNSQARSVITMLGESYDGVDPAQINMYNSEGLEEPFQVTVYGDFSIGGTFSRANCLVSVGTPSIASGGSPTTLTLTSIRDTYGMVSGTDVIIPRFGVYNVGLSLRFASQVATAGFRQAAIAVNGVVQMQYNNPTTTSLNATNTTALCIHPMELMAGDVVTFTAFHNAGAALSLVAGSRAWVQLEEG